MVRSTFCNLVTARWQGGDVFGPWRAGRADRGHFLASSCVNVTTSRHWDASTATVLSPADGMGLSLMLGHRAAPESVTRNWHYQRRGLPRGVWGEDSECSSREKLEVGWNVLLRQKRRMGFCNKEEVVWLICHITVLSGPPICFDINTYSGAMSRHEDNTYPHTCDLQVLLLLFEEWAWCFNVLFGDSSI